MKHVIGHGGNWGNDAADAVAALGACAWISDVNARTTWTFLGLHVQARFNNFRSNKSISILTIFGRVLSVVH